MSKAEYTKRFRRIFLGEVCFPWKACNQQKRFAGSNPVLSASNLDSSIQTFHVISLLILMPCTHFQQV